MPLFEYKCHDCDQTFEELVSSSDAKPSCPSCGSDHTGKLLSVFAAGGGSSKSAGPSCGGGGCGSGFS
jgi:putative FmdB family regulatory protein